MSPETTLLAEPGLLVTTLRLVVDEQTYPIANIKNVATFTETPDQAASTATILLGLVVNLGAVLAIKVGGADEGPLFAVAVLVCMLGSVAFLLGLHWARNRVIIYGVVVVTPSIQVRAIATRDLGRMQRVLGALNHAVARR
jgi:hypothetical protein